VAWPPAFGMLPAYSVRFYCVSCRATTMDDDGLAVEPDEEGMWFDGSERLMGVCELRGVV
jgi:hypothetical protein